MINFKVIIDSAGNTDRKTLGTIKQYSVNAYDIYFYIPAEWEGYSFTSSIKRNDGTAITALLPLTTGLDNEGNYVLLNLTEWISDYKGEVKIQIFATYNGKTYSSSIVKLIVEEGVMPSNWTPSDVPNPYQAVLDYVNTQLALKVNKTFTIRTGTSSGNTFAMTGTEILLTTNFTPYASIANIVAGETIEVMMSKISKWFSSFADVVFTGDYSDLTNLPDLGDLAYLDSITSEYLPSGIVIDSSYVHTDNNFTSNLKTRLEGIEAGAQVNIIEGVSVNSTPLTPAAKVVNIVVPTNTSDLTNDSNFVATSDINKLIKSMELSQVESTGVITITWTCYDNTTGYTSIDLAIEQIIDPDTTYYNSETKSLVLGFVGGGSVIIPIGDLVDLYYADEITLTQYLDVDSKYKFKIKDSWISANVTTKLDKTGDSLNNVVTFTIASTRENINTGESHATLFGKIKKWFGDLKALAFKDAVTSAEMPSDTVFDSSYVHTDNNLTDSIISDITSNTSSRHTHTNKTLLDGFTGLRTTIRASASASDTDLVSEKATSTELELKEVLANKITAIRDSETATNVKYPSELAVRTLFDTGLIYSEDLIAINYPTDEQIAENPTYYQGVLPSVYMVLSWFNDKLAAAGYGDMLKSTFATNAKVAQGYVDKAIMADSATSADDSVLLGGQLPSYYLNYDNLTNTPEYGDMLKSVFATNEKASLGYVDKAILADDSVELGGQLPSYYLNYNNLTNTPDSLKNPYSLTFGTQTYDGSSAKTIAKSDLGLGNVDNIKQATKVEFDAHKADGTQHKKTARFVIGTSTAGWTTADCDYLCDGTADQTEINAAITALPATGGEIVILDGTYNITAKINVTKDNVSIKGNGNATILKRMFNSSVYEGVITLTSRSGCKIANLQVDGNKLSYAQIYNSGIYLGSSSNNTITSNTCNNSYYNIYLDSSGNNTIAGNTYNDNNRGIYLSSSSSNTITGNTYNNNNTGIYLSSSSSNTITGNTYNNNSTGIYLGSSSNNTITSNTCIRGTGLAEDYTASQHTIRLNGTGNNYNLISNNNCMGKAVTVDGGTGNSVYGNKYDSGDYKDFTQDEKTKLAGISDGANNYTHPTTAGNKHIPTGGAANQILKYSASGTAVWGDESVTPVVNNLTSTSTTSALSANQGKVLNELISSNVGDLQDTLDGKQDISLKGVANGYAELDATGKVPSGQLPSYVDDVLEYASLINFPATGESGKIYVALDTNKTYRWSGSSYTEISESLALGETSSTAYRGDKGKIAYDHSQIIDGSNPHNTTFANIANKPTTLSGYGITDASLKNPYSLTFGTQTYDGSSAKTIAKSDLGLGNVDNIKQMPISDGVLENYREKLVTLSGTSTAINLSLGNVFTHTLSGNTTYTISNAVNGQAHSFTLIVTMGSTVRTLTFPASVKWQGGEIPDLTTASKTYVLTFMTVDGGTTWLGMFGGEF